MKRFVKSSFILLTAMFITINSASAATPAELYDDVWKIVSKKYYDPSNNSQDWNKWRYRYQHPLQEQKEKTPQAAFFLVRRVRNAPRNGGDGARLSRREF